MKAIVSLYSEKNNEIKKFLDKFYCNKNIDSVNANTLVWKKTFENPIEIAEMIGVFVDNNDTYKINMWVSIDKDTFINVSEDTADSIIKYLYERFPY